jgi:predicted alpha/beta superfamily hydrolase
MNETVNHNSATTVPTDRDPSVVGDLRLHRFKSRVFRNQRMLRVWLPPRYDAPENASRRYPVFYLNDGQNLFDSSTSFTGIEWQVDQTADRLIRQEEIPPMIFVGIDNAREQRIKEYLPYRSTHPFIVRPRGIRYSEFLIDEVMPWTKQNYRVATGPENTALGGSSLGGLITLYTAIRRPGVFGLVLIESPSLWVSNRRVLSEAQNCRQWPNKIFLAIGTREIGNEQKDQRTVQSVQELAAILQRAGLNDDRLLVNIDEGATHSEGAWAHRFPQALQFFFGQSRTT